MKINAVIGMRGFFTFQDVSQVFVTRPAQVVRVWGEAMVNILVFCDGENDNGTNGANVVWQTSRPVTEYAEANAFSYKSEVAPVVVPKEVAVVDPTALHAHTTATASVPVTPTTTLDTSSTGPSGNQTHSTN